MLPSPKRKRNIVRQIILDPSWTPGINPQHRVKVPKNNLKEIQYKFFGLSRKVKIYSAQFE